MEFIEGGSLNDRLDGSPKESRLVRASGRANSRTMQYVHDREIVHRDLKPANILMASERRSEAEGGDERTLIPKIADFGLAKRLTIGNRVDHTRNGARLGELHVTRAIGGPR